MVSTFQLAITCSKITTEILQQGSSVSVVNFEQVNTGWVWLQEGLTG